jgi:hypothetical protein
MTNLNQSVDNLLRNLIGEMTNIYLQQKNSTNLIGHVHENDAIREKKKECVHILLEGNDYRPAVTPRDGTLICDICGREIGHNFKDMTLSQDIDKAVIAINTLLFFGMMNNLKPEAISTLISVKKVMPRISKMMAELIRYIQLDEQANNTQQNAMGVEYGANRLVSHYGNGVTGIFG